MTAFDLRYAEFNNAECFIRKPITISDLVEEVKTAKDMKINILFLHS